MVNNIHGIYLCRDKDLLFGYGGTFETFFDETSEDSHVSGYPSVGTSHSHTGFPHSGIGRHTAKINVQFTNNDNGCDITCQIRDIVTGAILVTKSIVYFGINPVSVEVTYNGGMVQGPPTYLEELAKLDHYSKAQYIPPDRRLKA